MAKTPKYEVPEGVPKPDAILVDRSLYAAGGENAKVHAYRDAFGHILGTPVWAMGIGGILGFAPKILLSADRNDSINFPPDHPTMPGEPRYTWVEAGDGVEFGYRVTPPTPRAPRGASPELVANLRAAGLIPEEQEKPEKKPAKS